MTTNSNKRRITVKYKSANPLFEQWLTEWKEEAKEKGSKLEFTYRNAVLSLKKCPISFNSGQECKILKGFGDHLCRLLDQRLRDHNSQLSDNPRTGLNNSETNNDENCKRIKRKNNKTKKNTEITSKSKNKKELIETPEIEKVAINYINEFENANDVNAFSNYSGEKSESPNRKNTICKVPSKETNQTEFTNSQHSEFASSQHTEFTNSQHTDFTNSQQTELTNSQHSEFTNSQQSQVSSSCDFYILEPGNFDVILYIDSSETSTDPLDPLLKELSKLSNVCQFEVKKLHVGDYIWICRDKITKKELVLPYIFERKRLDDLASSIKDGRYKEQKYRLKRSGIDNKYYLIEKCKIHFSFPVTSLQQAAINTAVQDGFTIKMTSNLSHTAKLLNKFSLLLTNRFGNKTLIKCPKENLGPVNLSNDLISLMSFNDFNQGSIKNKPMMVTDMFIKMLIQLKGMSVQKATAITLQYPTPLLLKKAIDESNNDDFQKGLSELIYEQQKVGLPLSKTVVQLFTSRQFK